MIAGKNISKDKIKFEPFDDCYPCYGGNGKRGFVNTYNYNGRYSIIGRQGALCGNINMAEGKFYATEHAVVVTLYDNIDFFWNMYILEALNLNQYSTGAAQPGLSVANILNVIIPLPPYKEQIRISNKLFSAIEVIKSIDRDKTDLQDTIQLTKSKILDLAIRGKLVPQDLNDEPARALLERIRAEKQELIKQGKIKPDKRDSVIFKGDDNSYYETIGNQTKNIDSEIPFDLPDGWEWCNLSMIGQTNIGLTYNPTSVSSSGTIVLRSSNIINSHLDFTDLVRVNTKIRDNQFVENNDILICARNGSKSLVGKCALIKNLKERASFGAFMAIYRTICYNYVFCFFQTNVFRDIFFDGNSTAINQLTQSMIKNARIPLPPLNEQKRIADKVTQLFSLLDYISDSL